MKLPLELRLVVVSVNASSVMIRPEYWHGQNMLTQLDTREVSIGEVMIYGPHETEVEFLPPEIRG